MLLDKILQAIGIEGTILEHPKVESFGDFSVNLSRLKLTDEQKKETIKKLESIEEIEKIDEVSNFLNIRLRNNYFINYLNRVLKDGVKGVIPLALKQYKVIIDYSSPNIAKQFGIGHLRSTVIGQAIYNLFNFLGAEVIGDNHLGDWGTQFGKLLYMLDKQKLTQFDIAKLEELYVEFHQHPEWETEGQMWFKKLEEGDTQARQMWQKCVEISLKEFEKIYEILGVKLDVAYGESFYEDKMDEIKKLGIESQGARVIEIEGSNVPVMVVKTDGGTTYATRDLACLKFRVEKWQPDMIIYEVGAEQSEYFRNLFIAAKKVKIVPEHVKLIHTKHGMYLGSDGKKFKTRTGNTVKLEEVLKEAIERARKLGNSDEIKARAVGVGALKYFDLMHSVQSDIVFDWEKVMNLEGNSGPYLQYTYARTQSVLQKADLTPTPLQNFGEGNKGGEVVINDLEIAILRWLERFPEVVVEAASRYAPNLVCTYLYELAQRFNSFYNKYSILTPEILSTSPLLPPKLGGGIEGGGTSTVRDFRLALTAGVGEVLKSGLNLLGIEALERM